MYMCAQNEYILCKGIKRCLTENETEAEAETKAETETETETVGASIEFTRLVTQKRTVSLSICSSAR